VPLEELLAELDSLNDVREVVVTGVEITSWGNDLPGRPSFATLVAALCHARPEVRFRLGSLEPKAITGEWLAVVSKLPNLCRHFHLPLQSGCDATLARMSRRYNTRQYAASLARIRDVFPDAAITTDFIVGFPGETDDEWAQSLSFFASCGFARGHFFPYSKRDGTRAASMPNQVPQTTKKERAIQAKSTAAGMAKNYAASLVSKTVTVLFEEVKNGFWQGHAENYSLVKVKTGNQNLRNCCVEVLITGHEGEVLLGETTPR